MMTSMGVYPKGSWYLSQDRTCFWDQGLFKKLVDVLGPHNAITDHHSVDQVMSILGVLLVVEMRLYRPILNLQNLDPTKLLESVPHILVTYKCQLVGLRQRSPTRKVVEDEVGRLHGSYSKGL